MSKKVKYNKNKTTIEGMKPQSLMVYEIEMSDGEKGYSTFGISEENVAKINPNLLKETEEMIEISDKEFQELFDAHRKERYRNIIIENRNGEKIKVEIDKGTKKEILKEIIEAYQNEQPIYIENKEGYAEYPSDENEELALYSEDGCAHIYYIGLTGGKIKKFLQLNDEEANGGTILSTLSIKKAKTDNNIVKVMKILSEYDKKELKKEKKVKNKNKKN
jgi:hypothetical protein